jgi:hypothetical protein
MRKVLLLAAALALLASNAVDAADSAGVPIHKVKELVRMAAAAGQISKSKPKPLPVPEAIFAAKKVTVSSCEEFFARVRARGVYVPGKCD